MSACLRALVMDPALSRIEREYVIAHMREEKPDLLLVIGSTHSTISAKDYVIDGESLTVDKINGIQSKSPVRVYFTHKKRGIFFDSTVSLQRFGGPGAIPISAEVYKESPQASRNEYPVMTISLGDTSLRLRPENWFPVEPVFPDTSILHDKLVQVERLQDKLGIKDHAFFAVRTFMYIAKRAGRDVAALPAPTGSLVFLDDKAVSFVVDRELSPCLGAMERIQIELAYEVRRIMVQAEPAGSIRFTARSDVFAARILAIEEEDRRFIFERTYRSRYS